MKRNRIVVAVLIFFLSDLAAFAQTPAENIILITLDGMRWQEVFTGADSALIKNKEYVDDVVGLRARFWHDQSEIRREKLMPFFWSTLAKEGVLFGNRTYDNNVNCSNNMWFSYPGYNEILSGFADDQRIKSNDKFNNPNETVLEFLNKQAKYKGKVAAFGSWDVFPFIINEERSGVPVNAGFKPATQTRLSPREVFLNELQVEIPSPWGGVRLDAFTHHYALEYMKKYKPKVVYIAYGETDDFAHNGKYDAYLKSAYQTDQFIKAVWEWVQSEPQYRNKTAIVITTDHGRGTIPADEWRSHGTKIKGADQIWIAAIGAGVKAQGEVKVAGQLYQNQVAATAAGLLGLTFTQDGKAGKPLELSK
ncbi:MAG: sulfatase-like hydrolase/transferase [Cyclobacteriaceae bacterium]|nr:sulfatase-like hydrolase/transferase [Cyclobacteriaceae bacterium]